MYLRFLKTSLSVTKNCAQLCVAIWYHYCLYNNVSSSEKYGFAQTLKQIALSNIAFAVLVPFRSHVGDNLGTKLINLLHIPRISRPDNGMRNSTGNTPIIREVAPKKSSFSYCKSNCASALSWRWL